MSLLQQIQQIAKISKEALDFIETHIENVEVKKGTLLLRNGEVCSNFYFVTKGMLRSYYFSDGKEVTNWFALENDFATSIFSFLSGKNGYENIETLEDTTIEMLSSNTLQDLYLQFPETERAGRLIMENYSIQLEERLINIQFKSAKDRYELLMKKYPEIILRAPLGAIASYLGITQETLSRIRGSK